MNTEKFELTILKSSELPEDHKANELFIQTPEGNLNLKGNDKFVCETIKDLINADGFFAAELRKNLAGILPEEFEAAIYKEYKRVGLPPNFTITSDPPKTELLQFEAIRSAERAEIEKISLFLVENFKDIAEMVAAGEKIKPVSEYAIMFLKELADRRQAGNDNEKIKTFLSENFSDELWTAAEQNHSENLGENELGLAEIVLNLLTELRERRRGQFFPVGTPFFVQTTIGKLTAGNVFCFAAEYIKGEHSFNAFQVLPHNEKGIIKTRDLANRDRAPQHWNNLEMEVWQFLQMDFSEFKPARERFRRLPLRTSSFSYTKEGLFQYFKDFLNGERGLASADVLADLCLIVQSESEGRIEKILKQKLMDQTFLGLSARRALSAFLTDFGFDWKHNADLMKCFHKTDAELIKLIEKGKEFVGELSNVPPPVQEIFQPTPPDVKKKPFGALVKLSTVEVGELFAVSNVDCKSGIALFQVTINEKNEVSAVFVGDDGNKTLEQFPVQYFAPADSFDVVKISMDYEFGWTEFQGVEVPRDIFHYFDNLNKEEILSFKEALDRHLLEFFNYEQIKANKPEAVQQIENALFGSEEIPNATCDHCGAPTNFPADSDLPVFCAKCDYLPKCETCGKVSGGGWRRCSDCEQLSKDESTIGSEPEEILEIPPVKQTAAQRGNVTLADVQRIKGKGTVSSKDQFNEDCVLILKALTTGGGLTVQQLESILNGSTERITKALEYMTTSAMSETNNFENFFFTRCINGLWIKEDHAARGLRYQAIYFQQGSIDATDSADIFQTVGVSLFSFEIVDSSGLQYSADLPKHERNGETWKILNVETREELIEAFALRGWKVAE